MVRHLHVASDGEEYVFREPTPGDARKYMEFINSFVREPMSGLLINKRITLKEEEAWLSGRLADVRARNAVMLTVERKGKVLGNCDINRMPWKHSHRAMLGIALVKDARGKGIGEALMRRTLELAARRMPGVESVDLSAFDYNDRALSLYRKVGFREYARIPKSAREGAEYIDEVLMRLELPCETAARDRPGRGRSSRK